MITVWENLPVVVELELEDLWWSSGSFPSWTILWFLWSAGPFPVQKILFLFRVDVLEREMCSSTAALLCLLTEKHKVVFKTSLWKRRVKLCTLTSVAPVKSMGFSFGVLGISPVPGKLLDALVRDSPCCQLQVWELLPRNEWVWLSRLCQGTSGCLLPPKVYCKQGTKPLVLMPYPLLGFPPNMSRWFPNYSIKAVRLKPRAAPFYY